MARCYITLSGAVSVMRHDLSKDSPSASPTITVTVGGEGSRGSETRALRQRNTETGRRAGFVRREVAPDTRALASLRALPCYITRRRALACPYTRRPVRQPASADAPFGLIYHSSVCLLVRTACTVRDCRLACEHLF